MIEVKYMRVVFALFLLPVCSIASGQQLPPELGQVETLIRAARFQDARQILDRLSASNQDPGTQLAIAAARAQNTLLRGLITRDRSGHSGALSMLMEHLPLLERVEDPNVQAKFKAAHAYALLGNREPDAARAQYGEAITLFERAGNAYDAAHARAMVIMMDHSRPRREKDMPVLEALVPAFEREIIYARSAGNDVALAYNERHLAAILHEGFGKLEEALVLYRASLASRERAGFYVLIPASLYSLGEVLVALGRTDEAIGFYRRSLARAGAIGFRRYMIDPHLRIGEILMAGDQSSQARREFQAALDAAVAEGHAASIERARESLASIAH